MIVESFIKSSLIPALFLSLLCLATGPLKGFTRDLFQGLLFAGALSFGIYMIRGGMGQFELGGMESLFYLPPILLLSVIFTGRFGLGFVPRLAVVSGLVLVLSHPLFPSLDLSSFSLGDVHLRVAVAFILLTWALWSMGERHFAEEGRWVSWTVGCLVAWGAAALFFLFESSALMSQLFGLFATVSGMILAVSFLFGWKVSARAASAYLMALPILCLAAGAFYMEVSSLRLVAFCLPFLVALFRLPVSYGRLKVLREIIVMGLLSALVVGWLVYQAYKASSGSLY